MQARFQSEHLSRYFVEAHVFQVGDCFTVCDAGGGTVDLISYCVLSLKPLRLEMCVVATGGHNFDFSPISQD